MKKLFLIITLLFCCGTLFGQANSILPEKARLEAQLQQARLEAHNYKVLYKAADAKADSLTIHIFNIVKEWRNMDAGIKKSTLILQKALDTNEKPNYTELILTGWNLVIPNPADKGKKPNDKDKP